MFCTDIPEELVDGQAAGDNSDTSSDEYDDDFEECDSDEVRRRVEVFSITALTRCILEPFASILYDLIILKLKIKRVN